MRYFLLVVGILSLLGGCDWFDSSTPVNRAGINPGADRQVAASNVLPSAGSGRQYDATIAPVDETRSGGQIGSIVPDKGGQKAQFEAAAKEEVERDKVAREERERRAKEEAERKAQEAKEAPTQAAGSPRAPVTATPVPPADSTALPTPVSAQSSDADYCKSLAQTYQNYVSASKAQHRDQARNAEADAALTQCPTNPKTAILTLEQVLKGAKVELPPRK